MKKIYKKLTTEQKKRDIIFSSCLSTQKQEKQNDTIHEVKKNQINATETINRLLNDRFFNDSHFKYNIVRK